jgi:hypothetical protein
MAGRLFAGMLGLGPAAPLLLDPRAVAAWAVGLGSVALLMPNSNQLLERCPVVLAETWDAVSTWQLPLTWQYGLKGALATSVIFCVAAASIPRAAQFIYYRF